MGDLGLSDPRAILLPHAFLPEGYAHFWTLRLGRMLTDFPVSEGALTPVTLPPSLPHMAVFSKRSREPVYSSQSLPAPKAVEMVLRGEWARREQRD